MRLPRLNNNQFQQVEKLAELSGVPLDHCPTCGSRPIPVGIEDFGWENGTYRYRDHDYDCDCETQKTLRKHYLVANIPDQYQRLNWNDYRGSNEVRETIQIFLDKWNSFKLNGMGLEFYGANLGTGKTFAATTVGKELVKLGESVYFKDFKEVISSYDQPDRNEIEGRLRDTTVLILDEVVPPMTEKQTKFFGFKFEELIRHRTNFNLPTIMTTNLDPDELHKIYPRTYSLLEAKQIRIELDGEDARRQSIAVENIELAMNEEVRPIT